MNTYDKFLGIVAKERNLHSVNPVGLGCMTLSWAYGIKPSDEDGAETAQPRAGCGYNHLDTARIYGLGHNETLIGKTVKDRRKEFPCVKTNIIVDGNQTPDRLPSKRSVARWTKVSSCYRPIISTFITCTAATSTRLSRIRSGNWPTR